MFFQNLLPNVKITRVVERSTDPGTSTGIVLDMCDYDGVLYVALMGAVVSSTEIEMHVSNFDISTAASSDYTVEGSMVGPCTGSNGLLAIDLYKPRSRYVSNIINISTGDVLEGAIAIQYRATKMPVTQPTSQFLSIDYYKTLASPATGDIS
jgi:hypothetical protein